MNIAWWHRFSASTVLAWSWRCCGPGSSVAGTVMTELSRSGAVGGGEPVGAGEPGRACGLGEGAWRGRVAAEHLVGPVQPDVRQQLERCPPEVALADGLEARTLRPALFGTRTLTRSPTWRTRSKLTFVDNPCQTAGAR